MKLIKNEVKYLQIRSIDPFGQVFLWNDKIYRGVYHHATQLCREFFQSGFLKTLIQKKMIPDTWISDVEHPDYGMILEHEKIESFSCPPEWTFSMVKDVAEFVLTLAEIAADYGYNMIDCHYNNVVFRDKKPVFLDVGSFYKAEKGVCGWFAYREFIQFYYYPLVLWSHGLNSYAKLSLQSDVFVTPSEFLIYQYKIFRYLKEPYLSLVARLPFLTVDFLCKPEEECREYFKQKVSSKFIQNILFRVKKFFNRYFDSRKKHPQILLKKIKGLKLKEKSSDWKDYHSNFYERNVENTIRFSKLTELISEFCPDARTGFDIAGNQGVFAEKILRDTKITQMICQDLDENAVEKGYRKHRDSDFAIDFLHYNIMNPDYISYYRKHPGKRIKTDIVIALALSHHLILGQGFYLDFIFDEISSYSKKYICIEFMPKGLWIPGLKVEVPDWYTVDWFRNEFKKKFELLCEIVLEDNRIVFIGKKLLR